MIHFEVHAVGEVRGYEGNKAWATRLVARVTTLDAAEAVCRLFGPSKTFTRSIAWDLAREAA